MFGRKVIGPELNIKRVGRLRVFLFVGWVCGIIWEIAKFGQPLGANNRTFVNSLFRFYVESFYGVAYTASTDITWFLRSILEVLRLVGDLSI